MATLPPLPVTPNQPRINKPLPNRVYSAPTTGKAEKTPVESNDIDVEVKSHYDMLKIKLEAKLSHVKTYIAELTSQNNEEYQKGLAILQMLTDDLFYYN